MAGLLNTRTDVRRNRLVPAPSRRAGRRGLPVIQRSDHPVHHERAPQRSAPTGIRINCTGPGVTETPILDQLRTAYGQDFPRRHPQAVGPGLRSRGTGRRAGVLEQPSRQLHFGPGALGRRRQSRRRDRRANSRKGAHCGQPDRLPPSRRRRPQLGSVGRRRRARHAELHHRGQGRRGGRSGQARQGFPARSRLRIRRARRAHSSFGTTRST